MALNGPIIVGGCHRSGTSLVRRLLDAHPHIHCGPELKFLAEFHRVHRESDRIGHLRFIDSTRSLLSDEELFAVLGAAFVEIHERAARNAGKRRWADKAPENIVFLDAWRQLQLGDGWAVLHVVRNPLDTLASMEETPFPLSVPSELDARIDHYLRYTEAGIEFSRNEPERYIRLYYEDLVRDPKGSIHTLMRRLGEQGSPAQLRFNDVAHQGGLEDPKVASTATVHSESVGRWRDTLSPDEAEHIVERAAGVWAALGAAKRWRPALDGLPAPTDG